MQAVPLATRSASLSECGRRPTNQDAVLVAALADGAELVAVADGMGGQAAGEIASSRTLEVLRRALDGGSDLAGAVLAANRAVFEEANTHPEHQGMGTTLVALLRRAGTYTIANVGDSRAYRIDGQGVRQLTLDHSFVAEAVRSGQLSMEEAEKSPWRHAVTRAVGTAPELEVDCHGPFDATDRHAVLLCTDGMYRAVTDEEIGRIVDDGAPPDAAVRALAARAYQAGSDDNITLALVRFETEAVAAHSGGAPPPETRPGDAAPPERPTVASMPESHADDDRGSRGGQFTLLTDPDTPVDHSPRRRARRVSARPQPGHGEWRGRPPARWPQTDDVVIFLIVATVILLVALLWLA